MGGVVQLGAASTAREFVANLLRGLIVAVGHLQEVASTARIFHAGRAALAAAPQR